jgi:membrane-associated phospholipid phosphatase
MFALILAAALAASQPADPAPQVDASASAPAASPGPAEAPAKAEKAKSKRTGKGKRKAKTAAKAKKGTKPVAAKDNCVEIGRAWLAAHGTPWEQLQILPNLPTVAVPAEGTKAPGAKAEADEPMPAVKQATTEALSEAKQPAASAGASAAPARFASSTMPTPNVGRAPRASLSVPYTPDEGSLYKLSAAGDTAFITAGALGTILPYVYRNRLITPIGVGDPSTLNALDRKALGYAYNPTLAWASDITAAAAVGLPVLLDLADLGPSSTLVEDTVVMTEVIAVTGALSNAAKYGLPRRSPLLYGAQAGTYSSNVDQYNGFYSMQTAVTFAALSATAFTLSERYDQTVWPWLATAAIGGSVAAERVLSGRAFYTDVIAGAVAGVAVGTLIPWLHLRTGISSSVVPTDHGIQISGGKSF